MKEVEEGNDGTHAVNEKRRLCFIITGEDGIFNNIATVGRK